MAHGKNLDKLRTLDEEILEEVIREGEARVQAQLTSAVAADQRALAWTGFVATLATAVGGGAATIGLSGKFLPLAVIGSLLAGLLSLSAFLAVRSARPTRFAMPGNMPENWLPEHWEPGHPHDLKQARIEQARCLNNQIMDNSEWAANTARDLNDSMLLAAISVCLAALFGLGFVAWAVLGHQAKSPVVWPTNSQDPS